MRILCLIEALGSGGAERQLTGLASLLKEEGNDVRVLTYFPKYFYKPVLDKAGVEHQFLEDAQGKFKRVIKLLKALKEYKPDVVIAYSPSAAEIACINKCFGGRYRLIVSERNTTQVLSLSEIIKFFCYRWADWIVPNSHRQESFIENYYPKLSAKTRLITNYVDTDYFCPDGDYRPHSPCRIICVGRDNPQKNQLRFLDAIKILADKQLLFKVDWYGSFESDYGRQCVQKIKDLNLEEWIEIKGETKTVRDEYRNHDIFCLPSIYEGFPNVLCEAMSCGLPVVCSNVCDNPVIVQEGVNGLLFNPENDIEMASAIERMILMRESEKNEISEANRNKSIELFSSKAFLEKYKRLF